MPSPQDNSPPSIGTLSHFIGQVQARNLLEVALESAFADNQAFPHTLLLGPAGVGKTTIAQLIAAEMAGEFIERLGQTVCTPAAVNGFLLQPEHEKAVLFLDEVHELPVFCQTCLYRAMEDGAVFLRNPHNDSTTRLQTLPFTLVAATTDPQSLLPPLRDRFKLVVQLQLYTCDEIVQILRQRSRQLAWQIEEPAYAEIAQRSLGTPRLALRLLESVHRTARSEGSTSITVDHLLRTLALEQLDELGLGPDEQKYLRLLYEAKAPVRLGVIATRMRMSAQTVSQVVEERLLHLDLIERAPQGRSLSFTGIEHVRRQKQRSEMNNA